MLAAHPCIELLEAFCDPLFGGAQFIENGHV
jgi:hypothetical protein